MMLAFVLRRSRQRTAFSCAGCVGYGTEGSMLEGFSIRPATEDDLPALLAIERKSYPLPWTEEHFRLEIEKPFAKVLALTDDETDAVVAGYIVFWMLFDECHILNVAVEREWKNQGVATHLIRSAIDNALKKDFKRVFLEVRKSNTSAVNLYQKLGFFIDHIKPKFYDDGEDAYFLVLYLQKENRF